MTPLIDSLEDRLELLIQRQSEEISRLEAERDALMEAGSELLELEANIHIAWEAIMWAWRDKASPDIVKQTEENRNKLFAASKKWRSLVPDFVLHPYNDGVEE